MPKKSVPNFVWRTTVCQTKVRFDRDSRGWMPGGGILFGGVIFGGYSLGVPLWPSPGLPESALLNPSG